MQRYGLFGKKKSKNPLKMSTPERKIFITLCYYVIAAAFSLVSITLGRRNSGPFAAALLSYFICEQHGHDPNDPCDTNSFRELTNLGVSLVTNILLNLFPMVALVYALNVKEMKEKCIFVLWSSTISVIAS